MATLNFFNPATLLPSPEVAVKPPPQPTGNSFLISEALRETTKLVKAKRDVDSLKAEANAYADYVEDQSPDLAELLRTKASQYRIGMDTSEERSGFLKGVIGLSRLEQQDRKLALTAEKNDKFNNAGTKLTNLRGLLDTYTRRELEWNQQEARAAEQNEKTRRELSDAGQDPGPAYQAKPNPYTGEVARLSGELESTIADTDSYPSKSSAKVGLPFNPAPGTGGDLFPQVEGPIDTGGDSAVVEDMRQPGEGPVAPLVGEAPPPPEEGTYDLPTPSVGAPPKAEIVPESEPPQLTENPPAGKTFKIDPTGATPPVEVAPAIPKAISPADAADPMYRRMQAKLAANQVIKDSAIKDVQSAFNNLEAQKEAIKDKSQLSRLAKLKDEAEKEIAAIKPNDPNLDTLTKAITRRYEKAANDVMTMSIAQMDKNAIIEGDQSAIYETSAGPNTPSMTLNLKERRVGNEIRVFKVETDGTTLTDVTDQIKAGLLKRVGPSANGGSTRPPMKTLKDMGL